MAPTFTMPKFSVIIPTYGRGSLAKTLASIKSQDRDDVEVVVVGDRFQVSEAIIDGTEQVFNDSGLSGQFIRSDPAKETARKFPPRNEGTAVATGEYAFFMDDDDIYTPGAFAAIDRAVTTDPDVTHIFRMEFRNGRVCWETKSLELRSRNVGTPLMVSRRERCAKWQYSSLNATLYMLDTAKNNNNNLMWQDHIIVKVRG